MSLAPTPTVRTMQGGQPSFGKPRESLGISAGSPSRTPTDMENITYLAAASRSNPDGETAEVPEAPQLRRVIRADTPPRAGLDEDQREVLWMVFSQGRCVRADLVALTDAIELEVFAGAELRRVLRFLRDAGARTYAARLRAKLEGRGFRERRQSPRVFWQR